MSSLQHYIRVHHIVSISQQYDNHMSVYAISTIVEKGEIDSTKSQIRTDLFTFRDWYRQINKKCVYAISTTLHSSSPYSFYLSTSFTAPSTKFSLFWCNFHVHPHTVLLHPFNSYYYRVHFPWLRTGRLRDHLRDPDISGCKATCTFAGSYDVYFSATCAFSRPKIDRLFYWYIFRNAWKVLIYSWKHL
jgi:hypothetical protein